MEAFLLQAKGASGPVLLAGIVERALKAKDVFSFDALLQLPNVQALRGTPQEPTLRLLEIFAYGTFADLKAGEAAELAPQALAKLRVLTLVSLASKQKSLQYGQLYPALGLADGDSSALEEVIVQAISSGLLEGRIDQRGSKLEVASAAGRDLPSNSMEAVDSLLAKVREWKEVVDTASTQISAELQALNAAAAADKERKAALDAAIEKEAIRLRQQQQQQQHAQQQSYPPQHHPHHHHHPQMQPRATAAASATTSSAAGVGGGVGGGFLGSLASMMGVGMGVGARTASGSSSAAAAVDAAAASPVRRAAGAGPSPPAVRR